MRSIDGKLTNVTCMTLRSSFATSLLHQYRTGKLGHHLTEERFLELMAKQMNTSVEQLRTTYAACYSADFKDTVKIVSRHFMVVLNEMSDGGNDDADVEEGNFSRESTQLRRRALHTSDEVGDDANEGHHMFTHEEDWGSDELIGTFGKSKRNVVEQHDSEGRDNGNSTNKWLNEMKEADMVKNKGSRRTKHMKSKRKRRKLSEDYDE